MPSISHHPSFFKTALGSNDQFDGALKLCIAASNSARVLNLPILKQLLVVVLRGLAVVPADRVQQIIHRRVRLFRPCDCAGHVGAMSILGLFIRSVIGVAIFCSRLY